MFKACALAACHEQCSHFTVFNRFFCRTCQFLYIQFLPAYKRNFFYRCHVHRLRIHVYLFLCLSDFISRECCKLLLHFLLVVFCQPVKLGYPFCYHCFTSILLFPPLESNCTYPVKNKQHEKDTGTPVPHAPLYSVITCFMSEMLTSLSPIL